ncbi:MAG: DNA gyrase inhibitor YacG [Acidobacteria bacterium]|nr:DNA gyrase inhibitor YacG [Acidobacteriota bacterium]
MPDAPLCAYCRRRPVADPVRPFCSERCKMADLGRWLAGDYRLPAGADDDLEAEPGDSHDGARPEDGPRPRR